MIDEKYRSKYSKTKIEGMRYSMSLFVLYFGTKKRYNTGNLAHNNIILGSQYKELLNDIFKRKILADDFSLYLNIPTLIDSSIATDGCVGLYVLSPVTHLASGTDW